MSRRLVQLVDALAAWHIVASEADQLQRGIVNQSAAYPTQFNQ